MESNLIVNNFGPIVHVNMHLKNVNVFIGPQASGKSALAKLFTIFEAPRKFIKSKNGEIKEEILNFESSFKDILEEYNISSFLREDTEIIFDSALHSLKYKDGKIEYEPKLFYKIEKLVNLKNKFGENIVEIKRIICELDDLFFKFYLLCEERFGEHGYGALLDNLNKMTKEDVDWVINSVKENEELFSKYTSFYIPAERGFINIIKRSALNLQLNNVPIPKHILSFGAEIEKSNISEIDLNFIATSLRYKKINGEDKIIINNKQIINLTESASGVQSVIPILIPVLSNPSIEHKSFVIEEPELNLFPNAQYELIKLLERIRDDSPWEDVGSIHTYTTHSPYILSSFNNLLYAFKVKSNLRSNGIKHVGLNYELLNKEMDNIVNPIIQTDIDPSIFTAYQISNGGAESIFDEDLGLIKDNFIDDASDAMNDDFEALMNLMDDVR